MTFESCVVSDNMELECSARSYTHIQAHKHKSLGVGNGCIVVYYAVAKKKHECKFVSCMCICVYD